jgi:putative sigma-54 modulation protein
MQVEIMSRHFNLGEEHKEKITERLEKLERFSPRAPVSARMMLTHESGRFTADLGFFLKNSDFRARAEGIEPDQVADEVIENIKTQLRRFKDRITSRPKGTEGGLGRAMVADGEVAEALDEIDIQTEGFRLEDMTVEDAVENLRNSPRPFYVFRNTQTAKVGVVYRREDGEFGLLEPQEE